MDHNPELRTWRRTAPDAAPEAGAGKGRIERAGEIRNLRWQTRDHPPTAYENALGDAIETAFGEGHDTLEALVERVNGLGVRTPDGVPWTAARFEAEMARLGY